MRMMKTCWNHLNVLPDRSWHFATSLYSTMLWSTELAVKTLLPKTSLVDQDLTGPHVVPNEAQPEKCLNMEYSSIHGINTHTKHETAFTAYNAQAHCAHCTQSHLPCLSDAVEGATHTASAYVGITSRPRQYVASIFAVSLQSTMLWCTRDGFRTLLFTALLVVRTVPSHTCNAFPMLWRELRSQPTHNPQGADDRHKCELFLGPASM